MNRKQRAFLAAVAISIVGGLVAAYFASLPQEDSDKLQVMATFYPLYYFASEIGGERASVESLIPFNSEPHSWEPTPGDIVKADKCRLFIYNGAGLEPWVEDLLGALHSRGSMVVVDASDRINLTEEAHEDGDGHHHGKDPHIWIDPLLAAQQVDRILEGYTAADPSSAAYYRERARDLRSRLEALHLEFEEGLRNRTRNVIVTTHAGFNYIARCYNFTAEAVLGLSPDEQPSAAQIAEIVDFVRQSDLSVIFGEPVYDDRYIETIRAEVSQQTGRTVRVLILDGIHGRAGPHAGMDYFQIMRENLEALRQGLEVR